MGRRPPPAATAPPPGAAVLRPARPIVEATRLNPELPVGALEDKNIVLDVLVLLALDVRGIELSDADRERIRDCRDPKQLERWLSRVKTASSIAEVLGD